MSRPKSVRTGRTSYICSENDFIQLGLSGLMPERKYAVENNVKVTDLFGRGTDVLPKELRTFLLAFFQKAYQTQADLRVFLHPEYSPIDDANLVDLVDAVENSPRTPKRLDMDAGKAFAQELIVRYGFCALAHARAVASDIVTDVVESFRKEGMVVTSEQVRTLSNDDLWRLQGGFACLFCADHALHWRRCTSCNARTCQSCYVYRDIAFGLTVCGHCGVSF